MITGKLKEGFGFITQIAGAYTLITGLMPIINPGALKAMGIPTGFNLYHIFLSLTGIFLIIAGRYLGRKGTTGNEVSGKPATDFEKYPKLYLSLIFIIILILLFLGDIVEFLMRIL